MAALTFTYLEDLRRIDARVQMRCDSCGSEATCDRELLIRAAGQRAPILLATYRQSCPRRGCNGWSVFGGAIPWCEDPAELKRRVFDSDLINLACRVLKNAAYRRVKDDEARIPVRLALRVVHGFGADARICAAFWIKVTNPSPTPWDACHNELNWIALALIRLGWNIDAELR